MEKSRSSSKSLKMHEIQQLPRCQMPTTGQCIAPQSTRHQFQDRGHDNLDQVGYTCHQERRLKEFQIRYLARKFFYLWAKKTFGQVLPSKVRCFYEHKILQKTFGEWKEWWTVCRERKLSLRADSHYRHLLCNLIFKAWRAYVCQQQEKRNKYYVAESHAKKQKLLRTWQCWLVYVDVQRTKHGMQSVALAFRERSCLRISWAVWRRQHYQNCTGHKMNVLALQHWAQSLQFRAWLQWREMYLYSLNNKQKEARAVTHHQHWELKRCMEAWLGYLNLQRAKKHQKALAQEHHRSRIVWQCFSDWRLSWECRRRMHAHRKDVEKLAARIAVRRAFAHWKHYVVLCVEETQQCELAEKHYKHHLLKLGFKGLWQNVVNTRLQQMRKNLSYRQHQVTVLQKFWNCWKSRLEEKEEEQQQALTSVAHAHYRRVLMRRVFDMWLLKVCKLQEYQMREKRAVLHFERKLLHFFWCFWRRRTAACLEEQEGLVRAKDHYSTLLLLKTFCLWKQNTQERKTERLKEMQVLRFHYSKCLQQSWNKWREYVGHQREKWRKLVQADMHYWHTLLGKTFGAWKSYQHNIQCILYQVAEKEKQHTRLLLRQLLCTWRENALALIHEAKATTRADEHYRRITLSKVLLQWRHTALLQAYYRQQKMTAVMEIRKHLDIVCLQTLFLHWKKLTGESLMLRAQQHRAAQHHQQHLLQKYLLKWKKYHQQCLGKMLLQRQGDQLMTHRLCSASFSCWKTRMLQQQWEKQKTVQALWHWSLSLQRKVFDAWLRFSKGQKQKKDHIETSTGVYHAPLLREGVTRVLRNTADMKQLQGRLQAQCQLKVNKKAAYNVHQSVYRCAMLWKQKALSKKLSKPCSFLTPLNKQVTFKMLDVSPKTRGHSAEEEPWPSKYSHLPFHFADGDSVLSDLSSLRQARLPPQRHDFLLEYLESKELLRPPFTRDKTNRLQCTGTSSFLHRSEAPFQQTSVNKCSSQTGNLMPTPQMEESTFKHSSQMGNITHSYPSLICAPLPSIPLWTQDVRHAVQRPELWSPSFVPQIKAGAEMRGGQPVSGLKGAHSQDPQQDSVGKKLQPNLQPHLLSPEDLVGKWSHQTAAEGEEREHGSREEIVLQRKLEVELRHIQQQMQYYFSRKQELKFCQQQAQILQKWLEMSTQPEDQDGVQGVQEELDQLQARINTLAKAQLKERHQVQNLVARLRDIQIALNI
ncbi:protein SFI1 homolog isoform X1 [Grus americana]|uniref:protein SFI1 homolog isoform X1 n=1 Tax=Grus americana TaxID=9117 RepID=UPI00240844AC|nr:protein SFI1 homolog isoform X1 [Grus americana]XP_054699716.1 protein SFI1 homolog isoform X1 [Grus americana]XP_054699717.1 protein SFI1 homolog isoform X1 [Grus americana]XP_054699718.1 protein SFI1 homolog isoform X1 [Grus americana]XP_054699719.1 protein SFI1 homolog isoform X1 [Grus americana]XP_054699720.1 protein SFI1 homolog isoform X1 [Grus americana]XP_054699721.1 protein SFI1 homolog isoform X1 [Grus americana]